MTRRRLTEDDVEFVLEHEPEHIPIEGNCSAIDEETDREVERWVYEQLGAGNDWAWCCVVVKARWRDFEGWDCLGCCSYRSERDFKEGGYYDDLKGRALEHLNEVVERAGEALDELEQ